MYSFFSKPYEEAIMQITDKCILDDYKSQIISALRRERMLLKCSNRSNMTFIYFYLSIFCWFFTALFGGEYIHNFRFFNIKQLRWNIIFISIPDFAFHSGCGKCKTFSVPLFIRILSVINSCIVKLILYD